MNLKNHIAEYLSKKRVSSVSKDLSPAFTIVEVSILFVIFLIVAFLVAPLSLDETLQAKNVSRWRRVQSDFVNIFYSINTQKNNSDFILKKSFDDVMSGEIKSTIEPYKIIYMNGAFPSNNYRFSEFFMTHSNATVSYKLYSEPENGLYGKIMYDVNGQVGPNVWGRDIYGFNIYEDHFEPFCKNEPVSYQEKDCSKSGTGLCCSNYYLIGGRLK